MAVAEQTYAVMGWPARTCYDCAHADCVRRRRDRQVPCETCGHQILDGDRYRVTARIDGRVQRQIHALCEGGRSRLIAVDRQVHALAAAFITDLFKGLFESPADHAEAFTHEPVLTDRLARAIQSAIEDECHAIEEELRP